jgi:hypothetical protein
MSSAINYIITRCYLTAQGGDDTNGMNPAAWITLAIAAVVSGGDLVSILRHDRRLEFATKPTFMVLLIAVALLLRPSSQAERALFVVAIALGLAGDVFLMLPDRFLLPGIAAFLAGHLAYVAGFRFGRPFPAPGAGVAGRQGSGRPEESCHRVRRGHLAYDRERNRQRQPRRGSRRPSLFLLGRDLRLVPIRETGPVGSARQHRHVPVRPGSARALVGPWWLGGHLLRLGAKHLE